MSLDEPDQAGVCRCRYGAREFDGVVPVDLCGRIRDARVGEVAVVECRRPGVVPVAELWCRLTSEGGAQVRNSIDRLMRRVVCDVSGGLLGERAALTQQQTPHLSVLDIHV